MSITVRNIGELRAAIKDVPDNTKLALSVSGYDGEADGIVNIITAVEGGLAIDVVVRNDCDTGEPIVEFSNTNDKDMEYWV